MSRNCDSTCARRPFGMWWTMGHDPESQCQGSSKLQTIFHMLNALHFNDCRCSDGREHAHPQPRSPSPNRWLLRLRLNRQSQQSDPYRKKNQLPSQLPKPNLNHHQNLLQSPPLSARRVICLVRSPRLSLNKRHRLPRYQSVSLSSLKILCFSY